MGQETNDIAQLKKARDDLANVFKSQAIDELHDNGNLENIHKAILNVENAILELERRG